MSAGAAPAATRLSVADAVARVLDGACALPAERVALLDAAGRVLAEAVRSPLTLPPWDNAAMDGYAARAADVEGATAGDGRRLRVVEDIAAGRFPTRVVGPGEASRIMTGAPVPAGADSVIRVEDTDGGLAEVLVRDARDAGRNVRPAGEDARPGDPVLAAGVEIGPGQVAALAACGRSEVMVVRRPRVAIVGSGDELVELDRWHEALAGRKVVSTNGYALAAAVRLAGGEPVLLGTAPDDPDAIAERLAAARGCDVVLTSAGVSVGAHDHTRDVVARLGAELRFWRVRMRPGAPVGFGMLGGAPWLGLPGNPVSALVTFELFARPLVRRLAGHRRIFRRPIDAVLDESVQLAPGLAHFLRVTLAEGAPGAPLRARLTGPQGSGLLTSMARADALLAVPEDMTAVAAGTVLRAIPLAADAALTETYTP